MSDEDDSHQVRVSGIPQDLTPDEIELFFESERYCPNGGEVKNIRYLSSGVVLVTFCDGSVVDHLIGCVTMPDGTNLHVEPYKHSKSQNAVSGDSGVRTSQERRDSMSNFRSSSRTLFNKGSAESEDDHELMAGSRNEESEDAHEVMTRDLTRTDLSRSSSNHDVSNSRSHSSERSNMSNKSTDSLRDCPEVLNHGASSSSNSRGSGQSKANINVSSGSVSWRKNAMDRPDMRFNDYTGNTVSGNRPNGNRSHGFAAQRSNTFFDRRSGAQVYNRNFTHYGRMGTGKSRGRARGQMMERGPNGPGNSWSRRNQQWWNSQDMATKEGRDTLAEHKDDSHHEDAQADCPADNLFPLNDEDNDFPPPRDSYSADVKTKTLSFSVEKLKLLKLVIQSKDRSNTNGCRVTFDEKSHTVTMEGSADDLMLMEFHLHETALQSAASLLDIPKSSQKLLLSKRGEEWLAREFSQRNILAVFYVSEGRAHVVALDDAALQSASDLLGNILTSQKLPFDESAKSYLQSATWAGKVDEAESSGLVSIDTDYSQRLILISGNATDVSNWTAEVRKILNMNTSTTHSIKHKIGVVRLLKDQGHDMTAMVNASTGSSVQLEFQVDLIKVIGLRDDVEKAAKFIEAKYLKVVCYDKYETNIQGLTIEMFKSKTSFGSDMIDLLEHRNKCVIEVRGNSNRTAEPQRAVESVASKPAKRKSHRIHLQQGNIVEFKADVLVNSIANKNLERAGIVANCFLRAGGSRLQQELRQSVPQDFGNDVVITSAGGQLDAKFIFHAAIRRYRNQESLDRLYKLIRKCLEMAEKQHVKSIAFPTLGCGKLGYKPSDVAECFSHAVKKTGSDLQISIIAFEDHLLRDFKSSFSHDSTAGSSDNETKDDSWFDRGMKKFFARSTNMPVNNRIVFHINAMTNDVIRDVRENLAKRINEMVAEAPIKDDAIADLSDETASKIEALASSGVNIKIDRKKRTITVKGMKSLVDETRMKVLQLVFKEGSTQEKHRGSQPQGSFRYPKHWSFYTSVKQPAGKLDHKRTELTPGGNGIFEEVSRLVMKTWEPQKVGHGNDAAGLGAHTMKIRRIFCIENPSLYRPYMSRREEFCIAALVNNCHRVNGLQGEREIMTLKLGLKHLDAALASGVNECYLLHGTKHDMIDSIESTGLDSRLSGQNVLFGPGTYFTESSTKADQYADAKTQRSRNGQPLHMYVCRVLLGHTFVCQTPKPFKRAPCMQAGCYSDICPSKHPFVGNFDSVIGTHKSPTVRLLFREFVIYHPDQSYPEFLVEYERQ